MVQKDTFADAILTGIVSKQFAKLAAGEQLCRRTHRKLQNFKIFKSQTVATLLSQMSDMLRQHHAYQNTSRL